VRWITSTRPWSTTDRRYGGRRIPSAARAAQRAPAQASDHPLLDNVPSFREDPPDAFGSLQVVAHRFSLRPYDLTKARVTTTFNSALPLPPLVYGIAGLVFVLLFASPLAFLPASPTTGPADVVAYYEHNQRALEIIQVVRALSVPAFLLFLSGLALMLRKVEGTPAPLTAGVVASGAVLIALALAILAARWSIALDAAKLGSPPAVQTVRDLADALQSFTYFQPRP